MTYIIAEPCIDIKDLSCVDVCPVDCIHEFERILIIDPEECIDCGACEPECPVEAIFPEDALPDKWEPFVKINYAYGDGADVINMSVSTSSVSKGETLLDTAATLNAMRCDLLVVRHDQSGAPYLLAQKVASAVINAGDGTHEHPTQALLDALTIRRRRGGLMGLTVAICGDVLHSRVARSNIHLLTTMGSRVRVIGPPTLKPVW